MKNTESASRFAGSPQPGFVKFLPAVQIVEPHRIEDGAIVGDAASEQNPFRCLVVMVVAEDGGVVRRYDIGIEFNPQAEL